MFRRVSAYLVKLNWVLQAILLMGLALRLYGIGFGLPYTTAPDEPTHFSIALRIFQTGDLNPHWLNYPSLMFYLNALALIPYFWFEKIQGVASIPAGLPYPEIVTMGVGRLALPSEFLFSRSLTAIFGVGSIALVYVIGRELRTSKWVGLLAALLLAISPANVFNSHLIRPDTFAVFFVLFSFFWARRILDDPNPWNYVWAGVGAGLAVSSKYNVPLVVLPMVAAHFLRYGRQGFLHKELFLGLVMSAATFLLTTPFAVLDFPRFIKDVGYEVTAQAAGHAGSEGNVFSWYIDFLLTTEGFVFIVAALEAAWLLFARSKSGLVLLSFPIVYFVFINQFIVRNDRTILPLLPFLHLLTALFVYDLCAQVLELQDLSRRALIAGLVVFSALMVFQPAQMSVSQDLRLAQTDARDIAQVWVETNLPEGTRLVQEAYTPYLDTRRFMVQGVAAIIDHTPDWYVQNGFEYLIFSEAMYGRFYAEPDRYAQWVAMYNAFFARFPEVKRFNDNGYEVRVYKTGVTLPAHRVAARFGNYGEFIELVGYDDAASKWFRGEPLKETLYWRTLGTTPEPLEVELQLLDRNDRVVGGTRGDLFQGKGWPEGIFATEWTIQPQSDAAPGMYRLVVNVVQTRFNYTTPTKNWTGDDIGRVTLGPFKLAALPTSATELQAARPADVRFGDQIGLVGYTFGDARPGGALSLTLYWKALARPMHDYTVFVHLLDAEGKVRAQVDTQPRGGAYPTSEWDNGEIVRDEFALKLPADLAPGSYGLELGLYEYPSLVRLVVVGASNQVLGDHWVLPDPVQVIQ